MSYSLYDTIRSSRYENCVILTYSINLNLYESIIWKRLYTNGCHNNVLFVDGNECDHSILHDKKTLEYLGKGYLICPVYSIAAFHPKIILLTNKTSGKLIISSANVTVAALTQHSELINEFDYEESNEEYLYLFNDCWNYLMAICQEVPSYVMAQIEQLYETTPWLNKTGTRGIDFTFIAHPKHRKDYPSSIYDLLSSLISASTIDELTILSPFFDSDLRLLKQLKEKFNIAKTNFIIDPNLPIDPLTRPILSKETNIYRFSNPLDKTKYRSLHAKAIYFKAAPDSYLLCGSMNFTSNAMGIPFKQNNYEAGILYKSDNDNYFQRLGLADMVQNNNRLTINDLKFEKRELDERRSKYSIQITWVEFLYSEITINIKPAFLRNIKKLEIYFYDSADNNTGIIQIKDYFNENNHISSYIQDRYIIELSNCIELHAIYNDGMKAISNRAVLNKIETLRESTAKSDFTKKLKKLVRVLPTGQNYEMMLDLLSYFLFDSYEQYLKKSTTRREATVTEKYNNDNEEPRKLDITDVISTEPKKEHMCLSSMYGDQGGDVIKEIFINSFLRDKKNGRKLIVETVAEAYLEEKISLVIDEQDKDVREEEEEPEEEKERESGMDSEEEYNKKRNKDAEKRLLRSLVKKYVDHVSVLRKYSPNVNPNIENEFVRNYIAFLMITKGAGEEYRLFNKKDKSIHEDIALYNLSLATALINQDFAGLLTQYITEKRYQHERGFLKGLCSILTGIYLTDVYLQKMIDDRFRAYDLRKKDMLWISNRLILLSLLSRFNNESWNSIMCFVEEDFIILKNYSNKILKDISFQNISEIAKKAMEVNHSILNMYQKKDLNTPKSKPERGHLVVSTDGKLYIVKNIDGSNMVLHGGIDLQYKPFECATAIESKNINILGMEDTLKAYFNGLLLPNKSSWHIKA